MALRTCLDCGELTKATRCDDCIRIRSRARDDDRPSASARGYGVAWRRIRAAHLRDEPDCAFCGATATEVDHIERRSDGGSDDRSNLRSLCKPCHSRRTAVQVGWIRARAK